MKLKKIAKVLLSCVMAGALFTGCGGDSASSGDEDKPSEIKIGMIAHLNASEKKLNEIYQEAGKRAGLNITNYAFTYYDNLNLMQMGIESGSVDQISLYDSVAKYLMANNDKYEVAENASTKFFVDNFCFAVRADDTALKADLDKVISEMKSDGSLDKLVKEYITDVDNGQAPPAVAIPMADGVDTIKVGVTGDLPPLDLVLADNTPAGFNTAMLAEVAKRLNKNIELVQIDSGARASALAANQIDVIFWAIRPVDDSIPSDIDRPEGVEFSDSYFKDNSTHLKLKK